MKLVYHGHSCVQVMTKSGKSLLIDPFLRGNELAVSKPDDIKTDYILLTHAHTDHLADAEPISRANGAPIVAIFELANYLSWKGLETIEMNMGGTVDLGFARVKMVQAFHSSGILVREKQQIIYAGMPAGFLIYADGLTVLHAGDTCLYSDMKMIGERNQIDVAFIPIGDHYTMGPEDALQAAEWYNAKVVVPVHYNSFSLIKQDAIHFVTTLAEKGMKGRVMHPGESIEI